MCYGSITLINHLLTSKPAPGSHSTPLHQFPLTSSPPAPSPSPPSSPRPRTEPVNTQHHFGGPQRAASLNTRLEIGVESRAGNSMFGEFGVECASACVVVPKCLGGKARQTETRGREGLWGQAAQAA